MIPDCGDLEPDLECEGSLSWTDVEGSEHSVLRTVLTIEFIDKNTGWGGGGVIMKTIDGGKNWLKKEKPRTILAQGDFIIDQQGGVEHIFFFFSNNKISRIEEFIHKGFAGVNVVENALLDLRNGLVDGYTWNLEKKKEKSRVTLKSPEKDPVLIHEIFIRHK